MNGTDGRHTYVVDNELRDWLENYIGRTCSVNVSHDRMKKNAEDSGRPEAVAIYHLIVALNKQKKALSVEEMLLAKEQLPEDTPADLKEQLDSTRTDYNERRIKMLAYSMARVIMDKFTCPEDVPRIIWAAKLGSVYLAGLALVRGDDVNELYTGTPGKDEKYVNYSALHVAAAFGHGALVEFLLEKDADTTLVDDRNYTAIGYARHFDHLEIAEMIRAKHAER